MGYGVISQRPSCGSNVLLANVFFSNGVIVVSSVHAEGSCGCVKEALSFGVLWC